MKLMEHIKYTLRCSVKEKDPIIEVRRFESGFQISGGWELYDQISFGKVHFNIFQNQTTRVYIIQIPRVISECYIVGYDNCLPCKMIKEWIPEMDYITFNRDGILSAKIKACIGRMGLVGKVGFPLFIDVYGKNIWTPAQINDMFGVNIGEVDPCHM
jgi:hypothetical protein